MKTALVLLGHADPESWNAHLARRYRDALAAAGAAAELVPLADLRFDPVLRHGYRAPQALEPDLVALRDRIERADHVAWFFPTYWFAPPAVVRGACDRLLTPGWAFRYAPGKLLQERLLGGRTARVVATMDSPWLWYTFARGRALHTSFARGTLEFVGFDPVRVTTIHGVRSLSPHARDAWGRRIEALAAPDLAMVPKRPRLPAPAAALALPRGGASPLVPREP